MWRGAVLTALATLALSPSALAATEQQISVNGTGGASVSDGASNAAQEAAYNQALSAAIGNAQTKAQAVAQQLSLPLGPVLSFTEESDDYLGYCGIGFAAAPRVSENASTPASAGASSQLTPIPAKPKKHKAKKKAHKAQSSAETCQLEADVTLVYLVG
jgi:hypothetical protein